jgi:4-aminobutyrate aminotransferase
MSNLSNVWFKVTDLQVASGRGCRVTTVDGHEYLDFAGGLGTISTGHCHPKVVAAIQSQAERFVHAQANVYTHDTLETLASKLDDVTPASIDSFFFATSGAEITESAVKLAKQVTGRPNTIVFQGSYHGRTHLTMAMSTSKAVFRAGHAPLPAGVHVSTFPDPLASDQEATINASLRSFDRLLATQTAPSETACVILEPVLGEGGYVPAPPAFVEGIIERCREHRILFIADEIQSGFGRTGDWFAVDRLDLEPDILIMGKGMGSGFPISALGTRRELDDLWPKGSHGSTYGGNPLACAAAIATIDVMSEPGFMDNVRARGQQLRDGLYELKERYPGIRQVRGPGLMVACTFEDSDRVLPVLDHCRREANVLLLRAGTFNDIVRWVPPLVASSDEIDEALKAFGEALRATA